jgi:hypothetical protein
VSLLNDNEYSYGAIDDSNDDDNVDSNFSSANSSISLDVFDNANQFLNDYEEAQQQKNTAA